MLHAIIRFSVRNKLIVGLCILALIIAGIINLKKLPIDALPDITSNQVQVITVSPALAAPEVERLVTFPIEQANANIPGLVEMRSISRFGLSVVTVVFSDETDIYWARQQVAERLNQVRDEIPAAAGRPELAPATTGLGEIYQYVLRPKKGYEGKYDLAELRSLQDWVVRRQLLGINGVADVSSFGGYLKQYEVAVAPERLKSMNVTIADVFAALEKNNQNSGGAYIEKGPGALFIRTEGLASTTEDIGKIVVRYTDRGIPVFIKDVADVRMGHAIRYGAMTYKDKGEVAGAVVLMLKGANASQVVKKVKERMEHIKTTLPEGVILEPFYDRTKMVNNAIRTVKINLLEGALIVIVILVLFLGNLRAGLIVASVIPLSMLFAIIMMNLFGVSGNLMSLGALDFGLIVDGAVIIVEAVLFSLYHSKNLSGFQKLSALQLDEEVTRSATRMMNAAVFGQIIILIVYIPVLTLTGIEGKMFRPMAQTVTFALIGAFLLSMTYVPMMASWVLSKKVQHKESIADRMMKVLQRLYKPALAKALAFPKTVVAVSALLLALALFTMSRLGGEFIPELEEGDFAVDARILTGSNLNESIAQSTKAAAILQSRFPEVEKIVSRIGASEIPTDPMPIEMTDIMITLKPKSEWVSASTSDELADKMSDALKELPGLTAGFQFPVQMRFNELISGARQDIVCKIFGENLDSLSATAHRLSTIIRNVNGATDVFVEVVTGLPQIVVQFKRDAMAHYQLSVSDVNQVIRTAFAGESAGLVYENERRYNLVVRLKAERRSDMADVQQLLIPAPNGTQIPLYQVADVSIKEGPNQIQREDAKRRIIVGFNVRGRDVESVVKELREKAGRLLKLPGGYYVTYGGQFENLMEARQRLSIAVPAALLLILVMLYFAFGSLKYGLLIFSAIPLSAIGGILSLWIRGMPFSISAGVGFIALFGVAVLNGIVLITEFNRLKKQGMQDIKQIVIKGTQIRLRPVLMTASVASLGFLPMALSHGPGAEVQRPLATVVIGGLVTATLLTLVLLPVLYAWLEKRGKVKPPVITVILLLLFANPAAAQQSISLEQALERAGKNNLALQATKKESAYWKQLQSGVFDPPKTQLGIEHGNVNSVDSDTWFTLNQSFSLPVVYRRQRELYQSQETLQQQMAHWKEAELHREVKKIFYQLTDALERKKLLQHLDSVYSRFQQATALRLKTGETSLLEKTTADAQLQQLKLQQQQLNADIVLLQKKWQWLLYTDEMLLPAYQSFKKEITVLLQADTSDALQHPQVLYNKHQEKMAAAQSAVERSKLSPDFGIGYSNLSIVGFQSPDGITNKYYGWGDRFHAFNFSVGIPLFNRAAKARIKASEVNEEVMKMQTASTAYQFKKNIELLREECLKQQNNLRYYEETGLQQATLIIRNAELAFKKGEIGYVEWTLLMNQAVSIRLSYYEAVQQFNQALIELEYLTGK